jgi:HK97 family phage prohead protease
MLDTPDAAAAYERCVKSLSIGSPMGLSVGFLAEDGAYEKNANGGHTFRECKLIEVTLTPVPCNELCGVQAVKRVNLAAIAARKAWVLCQTRIMMGECRC